MDSKNFSQSHSNGLNLEDEKKKEKIISDLKENFFKKQINISSYGEVLCALQSIPDDMKLPIKDFVKEYIDTFMKIKQLEQNITKGKVDPPPTVTKLPEE